MPDVALIQSGSNNGTVSPATPGSLTATPGNLLICIVAALGTSPTTATPAGGWFSASRNNGATLCFALYTQVNTAGGAINPSSVLGGTVTGWVACMFEFSQVGANSGQQGGNIQSSAGGTSISNRFPNGQTLAQELFTFAIARATATFSPVATSPSPLSVWSPSIQPQAGVQGLSVDFYWMSGLGMGVNQYPTFSGTLGSSVAFCTLSDWFNTAASNTTVGDNVGGQSGIYVPQFFQGMIGG